MNGKSRLQIKTARFTIDFASETMKPTYFNYGALVDALGRCKYIKEAFQTMDEMIVEEIKVSEVLIIHIFSSSVDFIKPKEQDNNNVFSINVWISIK